MIGAYNLVSTTVHAGATITRRASPLPPPPPFPLPPLPLPLLLLLSFLHSPLASYFFISLSASSHFPLLTPFFVPSHQFGIPLTFSLYSVNVTHHVD